MKIPSVTILAFALCSCLALTGCAKKMSDEKFAEVAQTLYENVSVQWDHQAGESWKTYYERRIAEACAQHGTSIGEWDRKMQDVKDHPEQFEKVVDRNMLSEILQWEAKRQSSEG